MTWILVLLAQLAVIALGIRQHQRAGLWSWTKFAFFLGFAALEGILVLVPILTIDLHSRIFIPALAVAFLLAALNFIWMIIVARRWKLPDGRTRLEACRDQQHMARK